jgi:spoIIIJ-associated protein
MADSGNEYTGKSVDEAIAEGLNKLGLSREQVEIDVINRGSRGIFGLGSELARVRMVPRAIDAPPKPPSRPELKPSSAPAVATPPGMAAGEPSPFRTPSVSDLDMDEDEAGEAVRTGPADPETDEALAAMAVEMLSEIVRLMGFDAQVVADWRAPDDSSADRYLLLDIHGQDVSPLIGRRGETLASIQYLVRLMVNQRLKQWKNIVVDVEHYKERRVAQLTQLALRMADQVIQSGRAVSLEPMPANERRIVHIALRDHPAVYTQSSGEGDRRKVHIVAKS